MSERHKPPAGPLLNFRTQSYTQAERAGSVQPDQQGQRQRVSWTVGGGPSTNLASNNPYREGSLGVPQAQQQRPSTVNIPSARAPSAFQSPPHHAPPAAGPATSSDVDMDEEEFLPPPGPPPGHAAKKQEFQPPPGPPPPVASPPPYDPWLGPDDSLRPPPSFSMARLQQTSPTANADHDDARRAHAWIRDNPLWRAVEHDGYVIERIEGGDLRLTVPPNTVDVTQYFPALGRSYVRTGTSLGDTILLSDIPIYASLRQSPMSTGRPQTLYFELQVLGLGDRYGTGRQVESGIAIGFVAPPYPAWRLPGWHRGSLGVHGDDGRRYVDNSYGGQAFTSSFKKNDTIGIGMTYAPPIHGDRVSTRCQVFFTRNGKRDGGWDLHEEQDRDTDAGSIEGLEGEHDLLAAVGVFGSVEFECVFRREEWLYKP